MKKLVAILAASVLGIGSMVVSQPAHSKDCIKFICIPLVGCFPTLCAVSDNKLVNPNDQHGNLDQQICLESDLGNDSTGRCDQFDLGIE